MVNYIRERAGKQEKQKFNQFINKIGIYAPMSQTEVH